MNRVQFIKNIVKGKDVLDVGGIGRGHKQNKVWLHKCLLESANFVLGVDILKEEIKKLKKLGYNFIYGDAEKLDRYVNRKFDVCVAGEILEHLANPGLFLTSIKKNLKDEGFLIITTPNPFALGNIFRILKYVFRIKIKDIEKEHKAWYCLVTLQHLLESFGFKIEHIFTLRPEREKRWLTRIKERLYGNANSTIICVAKKI